MRTKPKMHRGDRITQRWLAEERAAKVQAELKAEAARQHAQWELAALRNGCPYDPASEPYYSDAAW